MDKPTTLDQETKRARGRPVMGPDERLRAVTVRMTNAQREKLMAMGGAKQVRRWIDASASVDGHA